MIEVAEIGEVCTSLGEALQKVVFDGGVIVLIFQDDDQHAVEILWRRRRCGRGGSVLAKAENCNYSKSECYVSKSASVPEPERHVFSKSFEVLKF